MTNYKQKAEELIDFIYEGKSPYHVVYNVKQSLNKHNFKELKFEDKWELESNGSYFVSMNDSSIFAFKMGKEKVSDKGFKIISAHSDSPSFKIKPSSEISVEDKYIKLNVETYGAPILNTWLDRPLSIAGRVSLKSDNPLKPISKLVDFDRPVLTIPNMAIHLNRTVNDGMALNKQIDMLPVAALINEEINKDAFLINEIAKELEVNTEDILEFDLNLFEFAKGTILGMNDEFISSGRLDDLAMVNAGLEALINSKGAGSTNVLAIFDNEEVGSRSKQGAGSPILKDILNRITSIVNCNEEERQRAIYNSFMVSADMAHALHPNHPEKHDPVNRPVINGGPVIKIEGNQKYTTDSDSCAVFEMICKKAGVPYQKFVNRSDMMGGGTLGNVSAGQLALKSVDVGNPMWAMHSVRETAGVKDHSYMIDAMTTFYNLK